MKKVLGIVLPLILVVAVLAGCSKNVTKKTFANSFGRAKTEITYYAHGDDVFKQTTKDTIGYSGLGDSEIKTFKKELRSDSDKLNKIKGVKETISFDDDEQLLIETITVDYEKIDKKKLKEVPGFSEEAKKKKISLKESEKELKKGGYKEIKVNKKD
ncbi:DUF1307 domain-containing protein [Lactobacillus sp. YT155]|uniref:DUF1307 domain-containing protein n=1 Tax=Lactobacillus sp. YT155 TaxID=3060955 RepID=UPI00265D7BFD|nr:DUF1307 domain-containing protein [Lactobacillus sp. YT155]MDO1604982.1 DUF1307 domain-containing protein [Lactobacillus sp. YT155]